MKATLDGQIVFDGEGLKVQAGNWKRSLVERAIAGLDGVLSIDSGLRGRQIKQTGVLRAASETALGEKISAIGSFMDGEGHTLITDSGEQFDNLRIDSFEVGEKGFGGSSVFCEYGIRYTQLRG